MYCYTQCPQTCSRPPPTHSSTGGYQTPTGKSRTVSCGVTAPFFSGPWCTGFCCSLCKSISWSRVNSGSSVVGLMATSSRRVYAIPKSAAPRASVPAADHPLPVPPQETFKYCSFSVSVGTLGPGAHKVGLSPLSISGGNGV